ncbi:hypothetical protein AMELA_G00100850 [Ameiurus melas]|uniref:Uncharacterized protein n=1 Tax=Ameiurus melas TaxID=219545 RepID=A0A7J6AT47_AMEME|nr:hypothetical protein AMELA_G00100850 [Ameiurus melas]
MKKNKKVAANNNNNSTSRKRTDVSSSQTQQQFASQAPQQRQKICSPTRKGRDKIPQKSPYPLLSSMLRWSCPREDKKALLASVNSQTPPSYGALP